MPLVVASRPAARQTVICHAVARHPRQGGRPQGEGKYRLVAHPRHRGGEARLRTPRSVVERGAAQENGAELPPQ
eukprot:6020451-Pyramimonas_sp.AAC.1